MTKRDDFTPVIADEYYKVVGVQRSGWGLVDREPVRGDSMKFTKLMKLEEDNLVYRVITAFEAPSTVVDMVFAGAFVTPQTFPVFRIESTRIVPAYMGLLTTSPVFHDAMAERCTGTVLRRKTISVGAFKSIPIALPSLAEQHRIIDLIGALDEAIEAADEAQAESARAFRLTLAEFREPKEGSRALTEVSENLDNRRVPVAGVLRSARAGVVPYYGAAGRTGWIDEAIFNEPLVCLGEDGAGLLNWESKAIAYRIDGPSWVNNHAHVLRATAVSTDWLALTLMHYDISLLINDGTRPKLNKGMLDQIRVRVDDGVPLDEGILLALKDAAEECGAVASALRNLRTNLLAVLLSGEHEISSSYDKHLGAIA